MDELTNNQIKMIMIYSVIIVIALSSLLIYGPTLKKSYTITYGDGCKETYVNDNLTSDICLNGRILNEKYKEQIRRRQNMTYFYNASNYTFNWSVQ